VNILFIINTPGQYYTWKRIIYDLRERHSVNVLVRDSGINSEIIRKDSDIEFDTFKSIRSRHVKYLELINHISEAIKLNRRCKFSLIVGFGIDASLSGLIMRKPSIVFTDVEATKIQNIILKRSATYIVIPFWFKRDMGKNSLRIKSFKELAYLHPKYFSPDHHIYDDLGISSNQRYVVLRFGSFTAFHDVGKHGFSFEEKKILVKKLSDYVKVFISSESIPPPDLRPFLLPVAPHKIHHVLYYADFLVSDTGTMTTEAAVLGTPVVQYVTNAMNFGNHVELNNRGLIISVSTAKEAINKALLFLERGNIREDWIQRRNNLLNEVIDIDSFMVDFIENYPKIGSSLRNEHDSHA
jgi:uncharacterized protein